MGKTWWTKFSLVVVLVLVSLAYLSPTLCDLSKFPSWVQMLLPKEKVKLGLDLQGGLHMVMGIDPKKIVNDAANLLADDLKEDLSKLSKTVQVEHLKDTSQVKIQLSSTDDYKEIRKRIRRYGVFDFVKQGPTELILDFETQEKRFRIKRAVDQSIEAIRNRIDEFGVSEPSITAEGTDRIVVQLPGVKDPQRAKELIGRTAKLEFKLVDESKNMKELEDLVSQVEKMGVKFVPGTDQKFSTYLQQFNDAVKDKIPQDTEMAFEKEVNPQTQQIRWVPYLIKKKSDVNGDHIRDARVYTDTQTNEYKVSLKFSAQGTKPFAKVTEENVGKRLAIVLDGIIHSAPVIQSKIAGGEASITFGSAMDPQVMFKEAQDTALVLRAGALPTTIELLEERTVGPSLGADSIKYGKKALVLAFIIISIFMTFYYKTSGLIATMALFLNLLFLVAVLALFGATLTLPGIAGIVLNLGMAVDANVLIFERIREEVRLKKSPRSAVEAGFEKAWATIFDANLTTVIAALALLAEGTGAIKGFAITLTIGTCCAVFTGVFVSRVIFEFIVEKFQPQEVSI